jgi:hypothetical protein
LHLHRHAKKTLEIVAGAPVRASLGQQHQSHAFWQQQPLLQQIESQPGADAV